MGMSQDSSPRRDRLAIQLLDVAEFTHAHWFFGNLYEAVVRIPDRIAASEPSSRLARTPFGPGSPGRYYVPVAPINAQPLLAPSWQDGTTRAAGRG